MQNAEAPFSFKGDISMNIYKKVERQREIIEKLNNWEQYIQEERENAYYGTGRNTREIKVQTSLKNDRMERIILDVNELETKKYELFNEYYDTMLELANIVFKYSKKSEHANAILKYARSEIEKDKMIEKGLNHIQFCLDIQEEAKLHKPAVRKMIYGQNSYCPKCNRSVYMIENREDCFLFKCRGCKTIFREMKKLNNH